MLALAAVVVLLAGDIEPVHAAAPTAFASSHVATLAAQLAPGSFRKLSSSLPPGVAQFSDLLKGSRPDGRSAPPIDTWTDDAQWDPQRKRAFFQGLRQSNRFLTYRALDNTWEELSLEQPNAPPLFERFGHLYGRTALDWRRGHFYRLVGNTLHRYAIDERRWETFTDAPIGGYISLDWHESLDMLVGLARGGTLHGFRDGKWRSIGPTDVDGYHSSAKYNAKRRDMLFLGGNKSLHSVGMLTADGKVKRMQDAPFAFSIRTDDLLHDPRSGNYLVLHHDRVLWEYNPDKDEWRIAMQAGSNTADWPFETKAGIVPIVVDELGIIVWLTGSGPVAYKHRSIFTR